jgi:hypothetical protein
MNKKISILFLIANVIIIISAIFLIIKVGDFPKKINDLLLAEAISKTALQFNVENFHTQLEMWEYAYQPSDERLEAFTRHNLALNSDADNLIALIGSSKNSFYGDGAAHAEKIISDLRQVQEDWAYLLTSINNYLAVSQSRASEAEIKQAKDSMDSMVFANEALFDRLEFNSEVESFSAAQSEYADSLKNEISSIINFSKIGISAMFALLIGGILWSSISFLKIERIVWFKKKS